MIIHVISLEEMRHLILNHLGRVVEVMSQHASLFLQKKIKHLIISSEKISIFSEEIMRRFILS
jgi:hypothetical protein